MSVLDIHAQMRVTHEERQYTSNTLWRFAFIQYNKKTHNTHISYLVLYGIFQNFVYIESHLHFT